MKIEKSNKFIISLQNILDYIIEKDGVTRGKKFYSAVNGKIKSLSFMSYKYRKSFFYDDENKGFNF